MVAGLKKDLRKILTEKKIPSHDCLAELADFVSVVLENEVSDYRQSAIDGTAGSLIDFQGDKIPAVVVPDLHGRGDFLLNIINYKLPKKFAGKAVSVYKALEMGLIRLIFVGDIMHTERNTKLRWLVAEDDFKKEIFTGTSISEEMAESLSLWAGVFSLKSAFPSYCHILKGNHENVMNVSANGDFSFRKYADEGAMVKAFIQNYYGDDILYMIHCVESALPLVAVGPNYVISHAEPMYCFSKEQIINARSHDEVVAGLTWTDNGDAAEGSATSVIKNLSVSDDISNYVYLGGHRCVSENYKLRQNGVYIQIHNPLNQNVALIYNDRKFNPDKDIICVN